MSTTTAQQSSDQQASDQQASDQQSSDQQSTDPPTETIDSGINPFKKRHPEVGASPGTLVIADDAVKELIAGGQHPREIVAEFAFDRTRLPSAFAQGLEVGDRRLGRNKIHGAPLRGRGNTGSERDAAVVEDWGTA
jgi:hypothetical protein